MLRLTGILFSALIVASVAIPWVSGPKIGDLTLLNLLNGIDPSSIKMADIKQALSTPINGDPMNAAPWAIAAFALSFPLAALFAVLGLLGYFSKPMALLLGILPLGAAGFAFYAAKRLKDVYPVGSGADAVAKFSAAFNQQGYTVGYGPQIYLGSAVLLMLTGLFVANRRRPR